jgi:hypothetical protein
MFSISFESSWNAPSSKVFSRFKLERFSVNSSSSSVRFVLDDDKLDDVVLIRSNSSTVALPKLFKYLTYLN